MYLKSITLKGFKSFPDRTTLELGPGVSVIVGPNGSGKSNVTDAVMWALGEQSPVAVRGHSMQDVIFAGAAGRQATREAEVELVLDDSDGTLALGAAEISVSRRLDRTGEGEYRLAGARCRLVDVIEMLSDTGLGKEMHSVISQGRVESIVTSKPRERRLLIEEAAGLGKHRKRRRRVALKLARTQENLDRALDVEREARSRLRPLKRQAEAAELHARLERQTLEARWELTADDLRARTETLMDAQAVGERARARRAEVERELHAVAVRRQAAEEALAGRSAEREQCSEWCFAARAAGERVADRAQAARTAAAVVAARLARGEERLAALDPEVGTGVPDAGSAARISALEDSLAALQLDRELELSRELDELEEHSGAAAVEVKRRAAVVQELGEARERAEGRVLQARGALREAERAVEAARRQAAGVGGELAAVNQFLRAQPGLPPGASVTALADGLDVDPGYELALTAALDGRLRAAIVPDRASARAVLDQAGSDGGRALLPRAEGLASGAPERDRPVVGAEQARPTVGAERLADHVRGRDDAVAVCRALLSDTWVVDDLDAVPDRFTGVAVTHSGRVWSAGGHELRQAPALGEERVLAQRNRREGLMAASEAAAQAEQSAAAALEVTAAASIEVGAQRERAVAEHREAVGARDEAGELQRRLAVAIERRRNAPDEGPGAGRSAQLTAELALERGVLERAERERAEHRARIAHLRVGIGRDQALGPPVSAVIDALNAAGDAISQQRSRLQSRLDAHRAAGEHVAAELRTCAQQEARMHAQLQHENETLTAAEVRTQQVRDQAAEVESELRELASRLGGEAPPASSRLSAPERDALTGRLQRLVRRREQLGPVNPLAQEEYAEALAHVEELETQRCDLEQALRELQKLIADIDRQIRETFQETFDDAAASFEELAAVLFPGGAGRLRLVGDQASFAQRLGGEPEPPEEADGEAEDLLGVEIEITPAGKECKRLSLLSGGEKSMTALAFLFAVFLARPCPFYILDEVEAALDDLNIERFLALLRRYSTRAQFIVVTHQKRTMEAADSLYGVSMGADGISKVISRRLPAQKAA